MADTFFIEGLNTLPEQVQLNKEDIKTNTDNIQRLGDLSDTYHDQIQSLNTKVSTNTANIATNTTNIATNSANWINIWKAGFLEIQGEKLSRNPFGEGTPYGSIYQWPNIMGNNYLCYISYSQGFTSPLVITPIQKLA